MAEREKRDREEISIELGDRPSNGHFDAAPKSTPAMLSSSSSAAAAPSNPVVSILSYCGSSILMTVTNKYVLSGTGFNLNFFLLAVQVRHHNLYQ